MRISETLCRAIAEQIVAGRMFFAEVRKHLKARVAEILRGMDKGDLATDGNAQPKNKEDKE